MNPTRHRLLLVPISLLAATALAACDPQVGPDYHGEPLAQIHGRLSLDTGLPTPEDGQIALVWERESTDSPRFPVVVEALDISGRFPSSFDFDLFGPPADNLLYDYTRGGRRPDESRIAAARIFALQGLTAGETMLGAAEDQILGVAEDHVLIYAETDVKAGTAAARYLNSTPSAGYHLMRFVRPTEEERRAADECLINAGSDEEIESCPDGFPRLMPAEDDLSTTVDVRLAEEPVDLGIPNLPFWE